MTGLEALQLQLDKAQKALAKDPENQELQLTVSELTSAKNALEQAQENKQPDDMLGRNAGRTAIERTPRPSVSSAEPLANVVGISKAPRLDAQGNEYARREYIETITMPIIQILTRPFDVQKADGTYTHKVGQIILSGLIPGSKTAEAGSGLRTLTLSREQAAKMIEASNLAVELIDLAKLVRPMRTKVLIDVLKDERGSISWLPNMIVFDDAIDAIRIEDAYKEVTAKRNKFSLTPTED